jgi:hypothetical protein
MYGKKFPVFSLSGFRIGSIIGILPLGKPGKSLGTAAYSGSALTIPAHLFQRPDEASCAIPGKNCPFSIVKGRTETFSCRVG